MVTFPHPAGDRAQPFPEDLPPRIDVGTTSCKAGSGHHEWAVGTLWSAVPTGADLDTHALRDAVLAAARKAIRRVPHQTDRGGRVMSMGETVSLLDDRSQPVSAGIAWYGSRGQQEARISRRESGRMPSSNKRPASRVRWSVTKYRGCAATHQALACSTRAYGEDRGHWLAALRAPSRPPLAGRPFRQAADHDGGLGLINYKDGLDRELGFRRMRGRGSGGARD
jgi:hypothetical protein